jgi:hypothetical protein
MVVPSAAPNTGALIQSTRDSRETSAATTMAMTTSQMNTKTPKLWRWRRGVSGVSHLVEIPRSQARMDTDNNWLYEAVRAP